MTRPPIDIRPLRIQVPPEDLEDLRSRARATRWPGELPGVGWTRGVPLGRLQELVARWVDGFDWRTHEEALNAHPQFLTTIEGQAVHFLHVRSARKDATPLLLLHGWPSSVLDLLGLIGPLTDPEAHDAPDAPAFHLVIPSLPGFGWSTPLAGPGMGPSRMGEVLAALMAALDYDSYGVQGGDTGSFVGPEVAKAAPDAVIGVHLNAAITFPLDPPAEVAALSEADRERWQRLDGSNDGYLQIQSKSPQTLSYALHDSPAGQLAWIAEMLHRLSEDPAAIPDDTILAQASLYWLTGTAGSAAQVYFEALNPAAWDGGDWNDREDDWRGDSEQDSADAPAEATEPAGEESGDWGSGGGDWVPEKGTTPTAYLLSTHDVTVRAFAERDHTVVRWTELDAGGHFLALERPEALIEDVRAFFAALA